MSFEHPFLPGVQYDIPANFTQPIQYASNGQPFYKNESGYFAPAIPEFTNPLGGEEFKNLLFAAEAQGPQSVLSLFQNPRIPGLFRELAKDSGFIQGVNQSPNFASQLYNLGGPPVDALGGSFGLGTPDLGSLAGSPGGLGNFTFDGARLSQFGNTGPDPGFYLQPGSVGGSNPSLFGSFLPGAPGSGGSASVGYSTSGGFNSSFNPLYATQPSGGGSSDPLGGYGGLLALGLGGAGLLASLFGGNESKTSSTTNLPPMSAAELQLLGINTSLAMSQLQAYNTQLGQQGQQNPLVQNLFQSELGQDAQTPQDLQRVKTACDAAGDAWPGGTNKCQEYYNTKEPQNRAGQRATQARQEEQDRLGRIGQLNQQGDQVGQLALRDAEQGTQQLRPDQLERIRGAADLSIQSGLSDIGQFRDESLNKIRLNSASRGLRPGDTPIQNDFHDVATDAQRTATNFTNNIRSQQLNTELTLPFEESKLRTASLGLAGDTALRRQALEEQLRQQTAQNRIGLATNAQASGLGLATGLNPASAFGALTSARSGSGTTTQTNQGSALSSLGPLLSGAGGLLQGYGSLYGNRQQQPV